ncbi:hypothetical protein [Desulfovibrio ferrophilus]|uniref:Uncharacterized protein n=1 Tax=Desulfovibrio ferrophilus TaxID=241368 RepID=A0A2Z6AY94_9BACT|nr:hypothetical protein [Desulfovibrio ferrophilus]BBD08145.1 uncharacterized protein DFE_1419 [Desulfovibrio ferrophilus]
MDTPVRPLGLIKDLLEDLGQEVSYAYDDLVFVGHNAFLFQFTGQGAFVDLYFNTQCKDAERQRLASAIIRGGVCRGLTVTPKGQYDLIENDDETISIEFS